MGKKRKLLQKRVGCESIIEEDSSQEQNSLQRTEKEVIFANEVLYGICFVPEDTSKTRIQLEEYPYCYYNNVELYKEVTAGEVTAGEVTAGEVIAGEVTAGKNRDGALVMGECVVVGTYDRIYEVFNGDEVIEGYTMEVLAAPRPDYVDYVYECGYNGEESAYGVAIWCDYYRQDVVDLLGDEYCVMSVSLLGSK